MGSHFVQTYEYARTGQHTWFAGLDPKSDVRDKTDSTDKDNDSEPSHRAILS